jgi:lipopolysaccharide transport system ATP-binding protein
LEKGELYLYDASDEVTKVYMQKSNELAIEMQDLKSVISTFPTDPVFRLLNIGIYQNGNITNHVGNGEAVELQIEYMVLKETHGLRIFFDLLDQNDTLLFRSFHDDSMAVIPVTSPGHFISRAVIPANWLAPSIYYIQFHAAIHNIRLVMPSIIRMPLFVQGTGIVNRAYVDDKIRSKLLPLLEWTTSNLHDASENAISEV